MPNYNRRTVKLPPIMSSIVGGPYGYLKNYPVKTVKPQVNIPNYNNNVMNMGSRPYSPAASDPGFISPPNSPRLNLAPIPYQPTLMMNNVNITPMKQDALNVVLSAPNFPKEKKDLTIKIFKYLTDQELQELMRKFMTEKPNQEFIYYLRDYMMRTRGITGGRNARRNRRTKKGRKNRN